MWRFSKYLGGLTSVVAVATIALVLASWLRAADKPTSRPLEGKLVWVGDSITAGESVSAEQSFVGQLQARAKAEQPNLTVIGQGRSGWATDTFLQNAKTVVDAMPDDATLVAIQLGTNDAHSNSPPAQIAAKCADNLQKLMKLCHEKAPHAAFIVVADGGRAQAAVAAAARRRLQRAHACRPQEHP